MTTMRAGTGLPVSLCGQTFGPLGLQQIQNLIQQDRRVCRAELARRACQLLGWADRRGVPKLMSARVALLRLHGGGWIDLPLPRNGNGNGRSWKTEGWDAEPPDGMGEVKDFALVRVEGAADSGRWNRLIQEYHYLGSGPSAGAQVRYWVREKEAILGAVSFGAAAWKVAARERWIGWSEVRRRAQLHLLVNNARFLIAPWAQSRNLGSRILARCTREVPADFARLYGYRPVLLESFVEADRFTGTVYRAANWHCVGQTTGRGKLDPSHQEALPVKTVWLSPLRSDWRRQLGVGR